MIKIYRKWKLVKKYEKASIANIKDCATILWYYWIQAEYPWIDLMTRARSFWYNLQGY